MRGYAVGTAIRNGISFFYTKLFWSNARLVRLPVFIKYKKNIQYGTGFTSGVGCRFYVGKNGQLIVGKNVIMGDYNQIEAEKKVTVGDNVLMASRIFVGDTSHGLYSGDKQDEPYTAPNERKIATKSISIGNNVWIGNNVSILQGVTIGDGVIIGAGSIVNHDIPDNVIVAGAPATIIKKYNEQSHKWEKMQ